MNSRFYYLFFVLLIIASSCKTKPGGDKPGVGGKSGELLVVMDDGIKASPGGILLRQILTQSYLGLPQEEPHFNLSIAPHHAFSDYMKTYRNIIVTEVSADVKQDTILYYNNIWAQPQSGVRITAKDTTILRQMVYRHELRLLSFFNKAERNRNIAYFKAVPNPSGIELIKKQWGIKLVVPGSFKKNKSNSTFTWFSEEASWGSEGLVVYSYPYVGEGTFSKEYLLNKRDSMLQKNLAGPATGSYMTTEHGFPVIYKEATIDSVKVVELRGLWKLNGDMMGGPFILRAHLDTKRNRVVVTEGYVYSPELPDKRDKVRHLEAIMYTFELEK